MVSFHFKPNPAEMVLGISVVAPKIGVQWLHMYHSIYVMAQKCKLIVLLVCGHGGVTRDEI